VEGGGEGDERRGDARRPENGLAAHAARDERGDGGGGKKRRKVEPPPGLALVPAGNGPHSPTQERGVLLLLAGRKVENVLSAL